MLGKIEGRRRRGQQRMRWLVGITNLMDMNLCKLREIVKDRKAWWVAVRGITRSQTGLSNWTTTKSEIKDNHTHIYTQKWYPGLWAKVWQYFNLQHFFTYHVPCTVCWGNQTLSSKTSRCLCYSRGHIGPAWAQCWLKRLSWIEVIVNQEFHWLPVIL